MDRLEQAKCPPSPIGVHHWMIPMIGAHPVGRCKHCGEDRKFDNSAADGMWEFRHQKAAASGDYVVRLTA